ncbi:hypothetical protein L484_017188 [Morus notabilis]|uniref:Uncharacterized protein n=1 Tax=Morus notabilis TaxID=981085 RepID=W9R5Z6_9ROSA|nr:hypothetical protein L484_017188 [Morus notabilis]
MRKLNCNMLSLLDDELCAGVGDPAQQHCRSTTKGFRTWDGVDAGTGEFILWWLWTRRKHFLIIRHTS